MEENRVHKDVDASASDILPKLFELGYEEIIQNIFLHLDPKSLKNCKTTCQMWREFIDRRIWGSLSSKKHLQKILDTNSPVNILQKSVIYARYRVNSANFLPTRFWENFLKKNINLEQNFSKGDSIVRNWQNTTEFD